MAKDPNDRNDYAVLVGWTHSEFADKLDLRLQTVQSTRHLQHGEVDNHHVVMTPNQAVLLANYLFEVTGQTQPSPRRGRLARWFGA
jgi:hypothetical protein